MTHDTNACPRAREDIITEALRDELIVFDAAASRAHSLNPTAAAVWRACDGRLTRGQIAEHCQLDPLAVDLALDGLADAKLLDGCAVTTERVSRRTAIRRLALTGAGLGIAVPVIRSIVAPSAAMAISGTNCVGQNECTGFQSYCTSSSTCRSGTAGQHESGAVCSAHDPCTFELVCEAGRCARPS